ncbi:MAG: DUF932 domain-containing protein [Thermoplasmata archaeon]
MKMRMNRKMEIELGEMDETWAKYDLYKAPISIDGKKTDYHAILRNEELIAIVGSRYYLFPNEEALKIADEAAREIGLVPFAPHSRRNNIRDYNIGSRLSRQALKNWEDEYSPARNYVMYNSKGTVMLATYRLPEDIHLDDTNDEIINLGCTVVNSIDGTRHFGCGIYTFRYICTNLAILQYKQIFGIKKYHTKKLEQMIPKVRNEMKLVKEKSEYVVEWYKYMIRTPITTDIVIKLIERGLPKYLIPQYINDYYNRIKADSFVDYEYLDHLSYKESQWQLYNDITQQIWHSPTDITTKEGYFDILHRIMWTDLDTTRETEA